MKHFIGFIGVSALAAGAVFLAGTGTASAQYYYPSQPRGYGYGGYADRSVGFYLGADLGVDFMQRVDTSRFGFPTSFTPRPGTRFGIEPGFNFLSTPYLTLAGEFETGVTYNYLSGVNVPSQANSVHGDYYQVPLLGNLILKLKTPSIVEPYIGVGGGGDYSSISLRNYNGFHVGFHDYETSSDEIDPAVQGMVGVKFRINPVTDVGVGYKYLATFTGNNVVNTHAVQASFNFRF